MIPTLWVYHKGKEADYYYIGEPSCAECKQALMLESYFVSSWHPKNTRHELLCLSCVPKMKERIYWSQERRLVRLANKPPIGAIPVSLQHHGWSDAHLSTYMAADSKFNAQMRNDTSNVQLNTRQLKYSGREDYTITDDDKPALIGKSVEQLELDSDWKNDVDTLLEFHGDEKNITLPVHADKRLLE